MLRRNAEGDARQCPENDTVRDSPQVAVHSHPYMEVLHILDGVAEAWMDGAENEKVRLEKGDTIALPPNVPHSFRVVGDQPLRLLGTHASPKRIVTYKDGRATGSRGYQVLDS
jgi:mannose-6-phosphate isomerase-like protein (cupin superfamily)